MYEYLKSIYSTIVYKDIVARYQLRNLVFVEKLFQFLADNIGQTFSAKSISDYLKSQKVRTSVNQVLNYTQYFTDAFIVDKLNRYDIVGKRFFEIGEKYYFEDLGIRNAIIGYRLQDKAKILKNVVYNHLRHIGYDVKIGNIKSQEIDFIGERKNEKIYVQVCFTFDNETTIQREFGNLLLINDNYKKIVVSRESELYNSFEGVEHFKFSDSIFVINFRREFLVLGSIFNRKCKLEMQYFFNSPVY